MQYGKQCLTVVTLIAAVIAVAACSTSESEPTATPAAPEPSIAGRYRMRPPGYAENADGSVDADYYLILNEDHTAQYEEQKIGSSDVAVIARGTWQRGETGAIIELTELFGEPVENPEVLKYEYVDGFPTGQGNIIGNPIEPVIKLTANPRTAGDMSEHIDYDCSAILRGEMTLEESGDHLMEMLIRTCNGRLTAQEVLGHEEFVLTKLYESA